ncbi:MAG: DUF4340 domain-containing protein [Planctomycetota bacterium]|nr:DUF4340 domain-containing protein [Planctomycetota bacterium]MEC9149027.1 DUF4340 domain-containing protein [Planctomycetota bacterium]
MKSGNPKSDNLVSLSFVGIAAVMMLVAFMTYPWITPPQLNDKMGKALFDWESLSADKVGTLEIVRYDSQSDQLIDFRVEKNNKGIWTIPSSEGYPADAEEQVREAVTSFSGLTVIGVIADQEEKFEDYGVLEPDRSTIEAGQQGVGIMVTVKDRNGDLVGSIVIGKSAKSGEEETQQQNLRFVRIPGQPLVYVIDYDPDILKTDFRDWIEKDVLDLKVIDIAEATLNDYQVVVDSKNPLKQRFRAKVQSEGTRWSLREFLEFDDPANPTERKVGDQEEINNVRLNKLAETLGSLEVVDVARKPPGVNADLTVLGDENDLLSLQSRGFVAVSRQRGLIEIYSMNGELSVATKDGITYRMRFGKNRPSEEGLKGSLDRYMMVSAAVNEDLFPMPEEPVLPSLPVESDNDDAPAPPGSETEDEETGKNSASEDDIEQERRRLQTEYRRKVELRNEKLAQAEDRVAELNRRFGDWYFVISEDSFKNLRIEREDLIVKKGALPKLNRGAAGSPSTPPTTGSEK